MKQATQQPPEQIMQLLFSSWISQAMHAAIRLGLPDLLAAGPLALDELTERCEAHPPYLLRLMRTLAAAGIFRETDDQAFELTPMGICLQADKMGPIIRMFQAPWHNRAWEKLAHSVKTGEIAFEMAFGMPCFQWMGQHPEAAVDFNQANRIKAMAAHAAILQSWDFSVITTIADVGGGVGGLLLPILDTYSHLQGTLVDLPHLETEANRQIKNLKLSDRCRFVGADFFQQIPSGADCYLLYNVLHDWDDARSRAILETCRNAMEPDAILLIIEAILPEPNTFSVGRLLDLEVLVMGGGMERTEAQYGELVDAAGLKLASVTQTDSDLAILCCRKAD